MERLLVDIDAWAGPAGKIPVAVLLCFGVAFLLVLLVLLVWQFGGRAVARRAIEGAIAEGGVRGLLVDPLRLELAGHADAIELKLGTVERNSQVGATATDELIGALRRLPLGMLVPEPGTPDGRGPDPALADAVAGPGLGPADAEILVKDWNEVQARPALIGGFWLRYRPRLVERGSGTGLVVLGEAGGPRQSTESLWAIKAPRSRFHYLLPSPAMRLALMAANNNAHARMALGAALDIDRGPVGLIALAEAEALPDDPDTLKITARGRLFLPGV